MDFGDDPLPGIEGTYMRAHWLMPESYDYNPNQEGERDDDL